MSTYKQFGAEPNFILQPDYQFSHNGYGLLQLTANYAVDIGSAGSSANFLKRGDALLEGSGLLNMALSYEKGWTCVKAEEKGRDGDIAYITGHYAAIVNNRDTTDTEAVMTSSVVSEPIESHPNFSVVQCPEIGDGTHALGGKWLGNNPPAVDNNPDNIYRAIWNISFSGQTQTKNITFAGFSPTDTTTTKTANRKAGVRSWMRPTITMRLTGYTKSSQLAQDTVKYVGWISGNGEVGALILPEAYQEIANDPLIVNAADVSVNTKGQKNWLITSANMEVYGGLYKVTADLMLSGVLGWDRDIYPNYNAI
jgi:hypothetical protein